MTQLAINTGLHARFYRQLKGWRKFRGYTQGQLAERLGVTQPLIAQFEAGRNTPKIDTVEKVAKALDLEADQFLFVAPPGLAPKIFEKSA